MKHIPNWLQELSVKINESLGGGKGLSLCGAFYLRRLQTPNWFWKSVVKVVDKLFWFETQHCRKSYLRRKKG